MNKKETINLTESDLRKIIKETIEKILIENKNRLLSEMSIPRKEYKEYKEYKENVEDLMPQILENWCLVRFCTITNRENCKKHWSDELRGHILTASRYSIKGNDSEQSRLRVLRQIWDENDFNNPEYLNLTIVNKFLKEGIDISSEAYGKVLEDNINNYNGLFQAILSRNITTIQNYIDKL